MHENVNVNIKPFRPMLAYDGDLRIFERLLQFHKRIYASYKLDGIRATVMNGQLISRSGKLIRSQRAQELFAIPQLEGVDGELIIGLPTGNDVFKRTVSGIMTTDASVIPWFHAFDIVRNEMTFEERQKFLYDKARDAKVLYHTSFRLVPVEQFRIECLPDLISLEQAAVEKGYEGLIVRSPTSNYKFGRSTEKEGGMGKLKRWEDAEGVVTGFEEMLHNDNPATVDARGYQVRSSHKENKSGLAMMGRVIINDLKYGWEVRVGSGFNHDERREIWMNPQNYMGRILKYKFLPHGTDKVARHPVFVGWRHKEDM
jgi:DNA ligase-1